MGNATLGAKIQTAKIGKEPLVLVPLSLWRKLEDILEDQEALASARYVRRIRTARRDIAAGNSVYRFR
jgi:PHD/YefM family antitoxin component YafN of YafNO toxin-antitoxin module